jgi:hypothetical protein
LGKRGKVKNGIMGKGGKRGKGKGGRFKSGAKGARGKNGEKGKGYGWGKRKGFQPLPIIPPKYLPLFPPLTLTPFSHP